MKMPSPRGDGIFVVDQSSAAGWEKIFMLSL